MTTSKRSDNNCVREKTFTNTRRKEAYPTQKGLLGAIRSPSFPNRARTTALEDDKRATEELASNDDDDERTNERTWRKSRWCASARRFVKRTTWLTCCYCACVDMKKCVGLKAHFFFVFFLPFLGFQRYGLSYLGFLYFFEISLWRLCAVSSTMCTLQNSFKSEAVALHPFLGVFVDAFLIQLVLTP